MAMKYGQLFTLITGAILYRAIDESVSTITSQVLGRMDNGTPELLSSPFESEAPRYAIEKDIELVSDEQVMAWRLAGYDL